MLFSVHRFINDGWRGSSHGIFPNPPHRFTFLPTRQRIYTLLSISLWMHSCPYMYGPTDCCLTYKGHREEIEQSLNFPRSFFKRELRAKSWGCCGARIWSMCWKVFDVWCEWSDFLEILHGVSVEIFFLYCVFRGLRVDWAFALVDFILVKLV